MTRILSNELITEKYTAVIGIIQDKLRSGNAVELKQDNIQFLYHTAASLLLVLVRLKCIERLERRSFKLTGNKRTGGYLYRKTDLLDHLTSYDLVNIERVRVDVELQKKITHVLIRRSIGETVESVLTPNKRRSFIQPGKVINKGKTRVRDFTQDVIIGQSIPEITSLPQVREAIEQESIKIFKVGNYDKAIELHELLLKLDQIIVAYNSITQS